MELESTRLKVAANKITMGMPNALYVLPAIYAVINESEIDDPDTWTNERLLSAVTDLPLYDIASCLESYERLKDLYLNLLIETTNKEK